MSIPMFICIPDGDDPGPPEPPDPDPDGPGRLLLGEPERLCDWFVMNMSQWTIFGMALCCQFICLKIDYAMRVQLYSNREPGEDELDSSLWTMEQKRMSKIGYCGLAALVFSSTIFSFVILGMIDLSIGFAIARGCYG